MYKPACAHRLDQCIKCTCLFALVYFKVDSGMQDCAIKCLSNDILFAADRLCKQRRKDYVFQVTLYDSCRAVNIIMHVKNVLTRVIYIRLKGIKSFSLAYFMN